MAETALKKFDQPDEVREFPRGRFEIVHLAGVSLGRATYQPGWKWSLHNAPSVGTLLCHAPHTGVVLSGHGVVLYEDGKRLDLLPGQAFYITATPHDSWVEGDEPYVSLHILTGPPTGTEK
ncbi:cupin domain-containing protein [Rhodoferax sp.]|uniref:cupin domain-containing protein n=1 Tax=Rhodoferax sp. TaxID=50421 RepID=UPI0025EF5837|nr:cupin domain-containing protein [Rhodoferax sp.]MCM2340957.1 cupin domain-containing protein [Rhodoferax sp.]